MVMVDVAQPVAPASITCDVAAAEALLELTSFAATHVGSLPLPTTPLAPSTRQSLVVTPSPEQLPAAAIAVQGKVIQSMYDTSSRFNEHSLDDNTGRVLAPMLQPAMNTFWPSFNQHHAGGHAAVTEPAASSQERSERPSRLSWQDATDVPYAARRAIAKQSARRQREAPKFSWVTLQGPGEGDGRGGKKVRGCTGFTWQKL